MLDGSLSLPGLLWLVKAWLADGRVFIPTPPVLQEGLKERGSKVTGSHREPSRHQAELLAPPRRAEPRTEKDAEPYLVGPASVKQRSGPVCLSKRAAASLRFGSSW